VNAPTLTADELLETLDRGGAVVLVDALAPMVYAHSHLPGAINVPSSNIDPYVLGRRIPDRSVQIIVYCSNPDCDDSHETAARLIELGYTNVWRYAGGKDEWRSRGLPLERDGKPYAPDTPVRSIPVDLE
jgi:rhodanese-related sulfurtransferase